MEDNYKDHKKWNTKGGSLLTIGKYETQKLGCGAMVKFLLCAVVVLSVLKPAVLPNSIFQKFDKKQTMSSNEKIQEYSPTTGDPAQSFETKQSQKISPSLSFNEESGDNSVIVYDEKQTTPSNEKIQNSSSITTGLVVSSQSFVTKQSEKTSLSVSFNELQKPGGSDAPALSYETKQSQEISPSASLNELPGPEPRYNSVIESDEKQTTPSNENLQEPSSTAAGSDARAQSFEAKQNMETGPSVSHNELQKPGDNLVIDVSVNKGKLIYNSANPRYNICSIEGDIRIVPNTSTIFVVASTPLDPNTTTWKIKPFPRKWESGTMEAVTVMTIQQLTDANQARSCDVTHDLPAIVFSTAKFSGNLFHVYTDMIYPLFLATRRYNGEVKLVVENYVSKYIEKYQPYLARLSHYPIINLDNETRVHCFSSVRVGLENPGALGYKFQDPENDQAMQQFRHFVKESLSLKRSEVERGKKPRLLMLLRKRTRSIINEDDVIDLAKIVGFEVVTADVETARDFPRIAHIVNSCDVMMGVHGAGLANMLYLPTNGTVLQVIPFGYLKWVGRYDYGDPTRGFGLNYVEYEITLDESSLAEKYPRDHPVLTDPLSIHIKKGWQAVYELYLCEQNVKLDVNRLRGSLEEAFRLYQ